MVSIKGWFNADILLINLLNLSLSFFYVCLANSALVTASSATEGIFALIFC